MAESSAILRCSRFRGRRNPHSIGEWLKAKGQGFYTEGTTGRNPHSIGEWLKGVAIVIRCAKVISVQYSGQLFQRIIFNFFSVSCGRTLLSPKCSTSPAYSFGNGITYRLSPDAIGIRAKSWRSDSWSFAKCFFSMFGAANTDFCTLRQPFLSSSFAHLSRRRSFSRS